MREAHMKAKVDISEGVSTTWTFSSMLPSGEDMGVTWYIPCGCEADFARLMLSKDVRRFLKARAKAVRD